MSQLGPSKLDIQAFAMHWTQEELKGIVTNLKLKVDDRTLQENNMTREQVMAQVNSVLAQAERNLEFSMLDSSQPEVQKQITQAKINFLTRANIFKRLQDEAVKHFMQIEHNRELHAALRSYIARVSEANYQQMIAEIERELIAQQEREFEMIQEELDRIHKEAMAEVNHIDHHIGKLNKEVNEHRAMRDHVWQEHAVEFVKVLDNFKINGNKVFENLSPNQKEELAKDIIVGEEKFEQRMKQLQYAKDQGKVELEGLKNQLKTISNKIRLEEGPKIEAKKEKNKESGLFINQQILEKELDSKISKNPEVVAILQKITQKESNIQEIDNKMQKFQQEHQSLVKNSLEKHFTPSEVAQLYKEDPNFEKRLKNEFKNSPQYESYKSKIDNVNAIVFEKKNEIRVNEEKKNQVLESEKNIEKSAESFNYKARVRPTQEGAFTRRR